MTADATVVSRGEGRDKEGKMPETRCRKPDGRRRAAPRLSRILYLASDIWHLASGGAYRAMRSLGSAGSDAGWRLSKS